MTPEKFLHEAKKFLQSEWSAKRLVPANREHLKAFIKIVEKKLDADSRNQA